MGRPPRRIMAQPHCSSSRNHLEGGLLGSRAAHYRLASFTTDDWLDNPDLGSFLLKQERGTMVLGEGVSAAHA
jgi:hypothetical protein|uniref:Uncharacterized protein n=1 Tax=Zea mays TaxID=4577 RepID=A0A804LI45_MAIZE